MSQDWDACRLAGWLAKSVQWAVPTNTRRTAALVSFASHPILSVERRGWRPYLNHTASCAEIILLGGSRLTILLYVPIVSQTEKARGTLWKRRGRTTTQGITWINRPLVGYATAVIGQYVLQCRAKSCLLSEWSSIETELLAAIDLLLQGLYLRSAVSRSH